MSTSYSASVIFGYCLPASKLERLTPHPLWGKHKFDPDTGEQVTQFVRSETRLALEHGDRLPRMTRFIRYDLGASILLGIELVDTGDLNYGDSNPDRFNLPSDSDCALVEKQVRKLLDKAGVPFDTTRMGYWLAGRVY